MASQIAPISNPAVAERSVICPAFIGREDALHNARATLSRAGEYEGGILLISGEAGIGKSRVLGETLFAARENAFTILQGACFETDRALPYAPLLDLVHRFAAATSNAVAAHAFQPAAAELVRGFPELTSVFAESASFEPFNPEHERRKLFHAISESIAALARTHPVLFVVEDIHWADESSLDLLLHLARRVSTQRVVLAFSYRSDEVSPTLAKLLADFDRTRAVTELKLARFSNVEMHAMLDAIFEDGTPAGGFTETLHTLTEGNPFFVEEVLKALLSAGDVARRADGAWHARPLARVQPPRTAVEAVRRRLSALSVPAREVASMAAVAGRRCDFAMLQALTQQNEYTLLSLVRELVDAQLVAETAPDQFAFRHALTREAIIGDLLTRERAALHRSVANELERQGANSDANIEALAYHAIGAMDWPRALAASTRAAQHALALHAPREALAHIDRAFDAAERAEVTPEVSLRLSRGHALETLGEIQQAHDEFTVALAGARALHDDRNAWEALHALGKLWAARNYATAGEYRRDALTLARVIGDASMIARSLNRVANWHVNIEQPAPALRGHAEALALFESLGDKLGVAETVDLLAMAHFIAGDMKQTAALYERAIELHKANNDARGIASATALLFLCHASMHTSCTAFGPSVTGTDLSQIDALLRSTRDIEWRPGDAFVRYLIGDSLAWRGDYARGIPLINESLSIADEMDHRQWQCGASRALGMLLLELQSPEQAREALERAHTIAIALDSRTWIRWSAAPLAIAMAQLGEFDKATHILDHAALPSPLGRDALRPRDEDSPTLGERYIALARAEIALLSGNAAHALAIANQRMTAERIGADSTTVRGCIPRFSLLRARTLTALEQFDDALAALTDAHSDAVSASAFALTWRIHAATGQLYRKQRRHADARAEFEIARKLASVLANGIADVSLRATFLTAVTEIAPLAPVRTQKQKAKDLYGGLTTRERDVARLVAQGKANRAIARTLGIGERTVESYVAGAMSKLGFSTRARLAAWSVEHGLTAAH